MAIKISVGVNKKIGLPDYGSAGSHCVIEVEADNSILQDAEQFLERVRGAYEVARQSVEMELAHHRTGNGASQPEKQRQEYRNDNSGGNNSGGNYGIASAKQLQFIGSLLKGIRGLDWQKLDRYCGNKFGGKACSQLSPKEASVLIDDLKLAKSGGKEIAA